MYFRESLLYSAVEKIYGKFSPLTIILVHSSSFKEHPREHSTEGMLEWMRVLSRYWQSICDVQWPFPAFGVRHAALEAGT